MVSMQRCVLALCLLFFGIPVNPAVAETELLVNGGFEITDLSAGFRFPGWSTTDGSLCAYVNEATAAEGGNFVAMCFYELWQDVPTIPGHPYQLRFALNGYIGQEIGGVNVVRVFWGEQEVGTVTNFTPFYYSPWIWTNIIVHSESPFTRLRFQRVGATPSLDGISVINLEEPPGLAAPIVSQSAFEGVTVQMVAKPTGTPPLVCQWFRNDSPQAGATNPILTMASVTGSNAGEYTISVTNQFGSMRSSAASLLVKPVPAIPTILSQPKSQSVVAGYTVTLTVAAVGEEPLQFQWLQDVTNLLAGTNVSLVLTNVDSVHTGAYTVLVSNLNGSTLSLPAMLTVVTGSVGGGFVEFSNSFPSNRVDAPVYDVDGSTRLSGDAWSAQLYAGVTDQNLHAIGTPTNFLTDLDAGYFNRVGQNPLTVPDVPADEHVYLQLRVWESAFGSTFEEARIRGGKYGRSATIQVRPDAENWDPAPLEGLGPFSVHTGDLLYASAKFEVGDMLPDGRPEWILTGEIDSIYSIEVSDGSGFWSPLILLTNTTGTVTFVDPQAVSSSARYYRAQILE